MAFPSPNPGQKPGHKSGQEVGGAAREMWPEIAKKTVCKKVIVVRILGGSKELVFNILGFSETFRGPGGFRKVREADRNISSSFRRNPTSWCRVMTEKPQKSRIKQATTIVSVDI